MKSSKLVQIVITDDNANKKDNQRLIFDVYRTVSSAVEFLKELGITVSYAALQRITQVSKDEMSFDINSDYDEKLMRLCPVNRRLSLNDALDNHSAHISVLPAMELL